jgi:hypothetical protein
MNKPYKYFVLCNKTNEIVNECNYPPALHHLQTWEPTIEPTIKELKQTKTVYIDTRYEAKLRLYNYVTFTKKGLEVPRYNPYGGSEIGKSVAMLNF